MSKVQIIHDAKNKPVYAVVPWQDYVRLAGEDAEDAALLARAMKSRGEEKFPASVANRIVAGENSLKVFREWRGLSQGDLSSASGVARQYLSQIETGHRKLGAVVAKRLSAPLMVSVEALLN
jgi:DNA-binding XRE family transcriptional regulator